MTDLGVARPELWGGLECSVVRVGDAYRNQFEETGHLQRPDDLDAIASLGITTLRYPVNWESTAPDHPHQMHWDLADAQLGRLQRLGLRPILGLLHHGSGPRYTAMTDPAFPALLASFAGEVARRYPWAEFYTPVNEPLTTARFSGLYGHWYPHGQDMGCFLRCLVNECLATLLAMREIRKANPSAKLVQTEDLGKIFSTPRLAAQAAHENERRWLSLDLLAGRVGRHHPWYATLLQHGIGEAELALLADGEATPDILGVNYYATSERFLDEDMHRYPACFHGGNGRQSYADVEALRMDLPANETGVRARLTEAWARYRLPLAITEVHHGSTREEQLRWLAEVWRDAVALRRDGMDLRAVTAWSLLGAVDWTSLLTERRGDYEPGAFDVRGPRPRMTVLGKALRQIAATGDLTHPVLGQPGWWRRDGRHYHPPARKSPAVLRRPRTVLIAGAAGRLGRALVEACEQRGLDITCPPRAELDIADPAQVEAALQRHRPWAVIDAAAPRGPDAARIIAAGSDTLARACAQRDLPLISFSSDRVFDGRLERPYLEGDPPSPGCPLGRSKAEAERRLAAAHPQALIIRMSRLFGAEDDPAEILPSLARRGTSGLFFTATYMPDLARAALDLMVDGEGGIWHLASAGALAMHDAERILSVTVDDATLAPPLVVLHSERAALMPGFGEAIQRQRELIASRRQSAIQSIAAE